MPLTLGIIVLLLYLNFRNARDVGLILFTLPFALVGGVWLLYILDYDLSIAAVVGFIALAGVATETGVVMVMYLEHAWAERRALAAAESREPTRRELREAIVEGALLRLRPKLMTVITIIVGLLPIMWGSGTGAAVMRRIAAPMVGGMVSATVLTLVIIPSLYLLLNGWQAAGTSRADNKASSSLHQIFNIDSEPFRTGDASLWQVATTAVTRPSRT